MARLTNEKYDQMLLNLGGIIRLEDYITAKDQILHKCLTHGGIYKAKPDYILRGRTGLDCCKAENSVLSKNKALYQEKLDKLNVQVKAIDEYRGSSVKIKHLCTIHKTEFVQVPGRVLKGEGIPCCNKSSLELEKFKSSYDEELLIKNPSIVRVGEIIKKHKPILHKCKIHNFQFLMSPFLAITGHKSSCCHPSKLRREKARDEYDEKIKKVNPKVVRVGDYIDASTKIKHHCLIHNEEHLSRPNQILRGSGLYCCCYYLEPLKELLTSEEKTPTYTYLYELVNHTGYIKVGISVDPNLRALDKEYGELISCWYLDSRLEAYAVEQAALRDFVLKRECPEELKMHRWHGFSEIRKQTPEVAIQVLNFYQSEILELGVYRFILKYLDINNIEKCICKEKIKKENNP